VRESIEKERQSIERETERERSGEKEKEGEKETEGWREACLPPSLGLCDASGRSEMGERERERERERM
jgi:hypothetical protein